MLELQLSEDIEKIGKKDDKIVIKDDNTWEIQKSYSIDELLKTKAEIEKRLSEQQENTITDIAKNDDAWNVLNKLYDRGYIDSTALLKQELTKIATCKDVTELYTDLLENYKTKGEGDVAPIEKIINSCKTEGGNVGGRDE